MAYTTTDLFILQNNAGTSVLNFRPGVVQVSRERREVNQDATICESGRQVVSSFADSYVESADLTFIDLPHSNESVDGTTVHGFSALRTFVQDVAEYRANQVAFKPQGSAAISTRYNYYIDQADLTSVIDYQTDGGDNVYSCKLTLRRVV